MSSATWNNTDYKSNLDFSCHKKTEGFSLWEYSSNKKASENEHSKMPHGLWREHPHTQFHLINPIEHLRRPPFYNRSESRIGMYFSEEKLFPNQTHCHSRISEVAKPSNLQDIRLIRNKEGACSFCVFCLLKPTPDICYIPIFTSKDNRRRNFILLLQQKKYH